MGTAAGVEWREMGLTRPSAAWQVRRGAGGARGQMDEKVRWRRVEKGPDQREVVIDLEEEWCDRCWREAGGRVWQGEG